MRARRRMGKKGEEREGGEMRKKGSEFLEEKKGRKRTKEKKKDIYLKENMRKCVGLLSRPEGKEKKRKEKKRKGWERASEDECQTGSKQAE
jgi:hypothetical protein